MSNKLYNLQISNLETSSEKIYTADILTSLESGKVVYLPNYPFFLNIQEQSTLFAQLTDKKHKNICFNYKTRTLGGFDQKTSSFANLCLLTTFMQRYAEFAQHTIANLFPQYQQALSWGRTSYRPNEIKGRLSSKRKDDTRLHVDSFAATPVHGHRILRVFSNINPFGAARVWELGESFPTVLERFSKTIPKFSRLSAKILHTIKLTKTQRSAYDHYQLHLHNQMKLSDSYQQTVTKEQVDFPAGSTWIVFTDQVSHAALSGQFLLEQTFYLPIEVMENPDTSPLRAWQKQLAKNSYASLIP